MATLTDTDVSRIEAATGVPSARFVDEEWLTPDEAAAYEQDRPLYGGYFRGGPRRLTLRRAKGACVFHDAQTGCTLGADVRPTACLLYPFELWPGGEWGAALAAHGSIEEARQRRGQACLALEETVGIEAALAAFETTPEQLEALGARLREEVHAHQRPRRRIVR